MYGNTSKEKMQVFRVPENVKNMTENANKSEKLHKIRRFEKAIFFTFSKRIEKRLSFFCGRILQKWSLFVILAKTEHVIINNLSRRKLCRLNKTISVQKLMIDFCLFIIYNFNKQTDVKQEVTNMKSMKRVLSAILMPVLVLSLMMGSFSLSVAAATALSDSVMVVDDDLASKAKGSSVTVTVGGVQYKGTVGKTAFATVQDAVKAVKAGGTIYVAPGVYSGDLKLGKSVSLYGNKADVSPNGDADKSVQSGDRAITGSQESILQNMAVSYTAVGEEEDPANTGSLTLNGFAMAGDGGIYLAGGRLENAQIEISNNVMEFINEQVYNRLGISEATFYAIRMGVVADSLNITMSTNIINNRILSVSATGDGLTSCGGVFTAWTGEMELSGNYIGNTSSDTFAIAQPGDATIVANNYFYNGEKARVYDGFKKRIEVYGNVFDGVGGTTANGTYTLGLYTNADSNNYFNGWSENTSRVWVYENTFKNSGRAIRLYAKLRAYDLANNASPVGTEIFSNIFEPTSTSDCTFVSFGFGDGIYNPKVYKNYTAGLNPRDICTTDSCAVGAEIDLDHYWLDRDMTVSSERLSISGISNADGVLFSSTKIAVAPEYTITTAVAAVNSITPKLKTAEGAYYELYTDAACTTLLPNDTLSLQTGANTVYAKVHYSEYSAVYKIIITKKVTYSTYLGSDEMVVSPEFSQYVTGQTIYVELQGEWRRAVVGHSAFSDISAAVNNAQTGDTIMITAGTYSDAITIAKGIKIRGAKAGINPTDMNDSDFGRNPERADRNEETIFTAQITLKSGISGLAVDGVMLTGGGFFRYDFTGHTNGLTLENILLTQNNVSYGLIYKARNDAGNSILTNFVLRNCRFEETATSYVTCAGSLASSTFEGNVYYKTKSGNGHYIGGTNGGTNSVIAFKNNVWYNCTGTNLVQSADGSETGNPNARADASYLFDGNRYIDCSSTNAGLIQRWKSGHKLTIINNRLEGTTKSTFSAIPQADTSGQTVVMHNNYFGPSVVKALTNAVDTTADCSYNYFANGPETSIAGDASYCPYYTDAAMTKLAGDCSITAITAPTAAIMDQDAAKITYACDAATDEVAFAISVSEGATYKLYKEESCKTEYADNKIALEGKLTTAFVKVLASDGITSKIYTIEISKPVNNRALLRGITEEGSTLVQLGNNKYHCEIPGDVVNANIMPLVSSGATVLMYEVGDTAFKNAIDTLSVYIPAGKTTTYVARVTSEDGKTVNTYTIEFYREKSTKAQLVAIDGALDNVVIDGTDATVYYPNETTSVVPKITVSDGASYKLYEQMGGNIEKIGAQTLKIGDNVLYLVVTAEDGITQTEYKLHLIRKDKSGDNYLRAEAFGSFGFKRPEEGEVLETPQLGLKQISNFSANEEYGLPYVYLFPDAYIESIDDEVVVSKGAMYDIFKNYNGGVLSGLLSNGTDASKIALSEGVNNLFIRVTAENNDTRIFNLRIYNFVKSTENALLGVEDFSTKLSGNVMTAAGTTDNPEISFYISENATAKVYADRKKTIPLNATMASRTDASEVTHNACTLEQPLKQPYAVYYIDITSQAGQRASYVVKITSGSFRATFTDVSSKFWAANYINTAYQMGITTGSAQSDGTVAFNPNGKATRQEVAIFICNLLGINANAYSNKKLSYTDSAAIAKWAQNAVKAVTAQGIMEGSGKKFNPTANITRQEFMAVMVRAAKLDTSKGSAGVLNAFKDKNKIASWAKVYVQTAVTYKLVNGDNGYIKPNADITRAEIVKIMVCAKDFVR